VRAGLAAEPEDRPSTGTVLATLRPGDELTLPWMLAGAPEADTDPTARVEPPTRPLTVPSPVAEPVHEPARQPSMAPPPPAGPEVRRPRLLPEGLMRTGPVARLQRKLVLGGSFAVVAAGFGVAPYLTFLAVALGALAVRTLSWTSESARQRQHLRGRRRWYDAVLTVASTPWYLVVAAGGTVMLMAWAGFITFMVGLAVALLAPSVSTALLVLGGVLALTVWWGPGAKRLRLPVRRAVASASHDPWVGWTVVAAVGIFLAAVVYAYLTGEPTWSPASGAPWGEGTALGSLLRWL
jgi:hypothetical protein